MVTETKLNIFELAENNSVHLEKEYQLLKERCDENKSSLLDDFAKKVQTGWKLSINMKDRELGGFLDAGEYISIRKLKEKQADELIDLDAMDISEKESELEESLRRHLKKYYQLRKIFDSAFANGEKYKYTALNIGGVGIIRYGSYCIIIDGEQTHNYKTMAFIKEDSADNYVESQKLSIDKLAREISDKNYMHLLAALKHEAEVEIHAPGDWAGMICNNDSYIEAVTEDDIRSDHIKSVRIERGYFNSIYRDSLIKEFKREPMSEGELYRLAVIKHIFTELEKRGIELELINEN
jgi:hypothetical protein